MNILRDIIFGYVNGLHGEPTMPKFFGFVCGNFIANVIDCWTKASTGRATMIAAMLINYAALWLSLMKDGFSTILDMISALMAGCTTNNALRIDQSNQDFKDIYDAMLIMRLLALIIFTVTKMLQIVRSIANASVIGLIISAVQLIGAVTLWKAKSE